MANNPDIRVIIGADKVETQSTLESDLKEVAKQISGGEKYPRVKVGVDIEGSRTLIESQLKEVTQGVSVGTSQNPIINLDTKSVISELAKIASGIQNVNKQSQNMGGGLSAKRTKEIRDMADSSAALVGNIATAYQKLTALASGQQISQSKLKQYLNDLAEAYANAFAWSDKLDAQEEKYFRNYKRRLEQREDYKSATGIIATQQSGWDSGVGAGLLSITKNVKTNPRNFMRNIKPVEFIERTDTPSVSAFGAETKAIETTNDSLTEHSTQMQAAIQAEALKANQSRATAAAIETESDALDSASSAAMEHAKTIEVTTTSNIKAFENQVRAMALANARAEGYELESVQAIASRNSENDTSTIQGAILSYRKPGEDISYVAQYALKPIEDASDELDEANQKAAELVLTTERIVQRQKDYTAEIQRTNQQRDKLVNQLQGRANTQYLRTLDPNASKAVKGEGRTELETKYNEIQGAINGLAKLDGTTSTLAQIKEKYSQIDTLLIAYIKRSKELQQLQYQATTLNAKDLDTNKENLRSAYGKLKAEYANSGVKSADFETSLGFDIEKMFDDDGGITKVANKIGILRRELQKLKTEQKAIISQTKKDNTFINSKSGIVENIRAAAKTGRNRLVDDTDLNEVETSLNAIQKKLNDGLADVGKLSPTYKAEIDSMIKDTNRLLKEKQKLTGSNQNYDAAYIDAVNTKRFSLQERFNRAKITGFTTGGGVDQYTEAHDAIGRLNESYEKLGNAVKEYQAALKSGSDTEDARKEVAKQAKDFNSVSVEAENAVKRIEAYNAAVTKATDTRKKATSNINSFEIFGQNNNRLFKNADLTKQYNDILNEFNVLMDTDTVDVAKLNEIVAKANEFKKLVKEMGYAGKTFSSQIGAQFQKLGIYFSGATIWNTINQSTRQMVNNVIDLDTAMTELKKVTDETAGTYTRFLDDAAARARRLGATLTDVVTATADFARLGWSIEDASALADAAIIYKNVGDGIENISDASSSIISTMKAFGIEANNAMRIVDSLNEVGKVLPLENYIG